VSPETQRYNQDRAPEYAALCVALAVAIDHALPAAENKLWHAHPVWFLAGNPIVGYSEQKPGIRLMFWSGADFDEPQLNVPGTLVEQGGSNPVGLPESGQAQGALAESGR